MANILIADDSSIMRRNLKIILTGSGHKVIGEASNGKQAILNYEELKPDLVTMDITMPIMDGIEATKSIISKYPEAKIIMISALDQKRKVFEALNNGARHYIVKPITKEKVLKIVDEVLITEGIGKPSQQIESKDLQSEKVEIEPFNIHNNNGTFLINLNKNLDTESLISLSMVLKGFLYIKPLKVVFDFNGLEEIDVMILSKLDEIAQNINGVGGEVQSICDKEDIISHGREYCKILFM